MTLKKTNTALILIDLQKGFDDEDYWGGNRNNKDAEKNIVEILSKWREFRLPIFHVVHSSTDTNSLLHKSNPGFEIKDEVKPIEGEDIITKNVNSAFIGTDLKERLDSNEIKNLVIVGLTSNHCVSTTTRMAGNYGYKTILVSDATATFDRKGINGEILPAELIHQTTLASLNEEFCMVKSTKQLLETK